MTVSEKKKPGGRGCGVVQLRPADLGTPCRDVRFLGCEALEACVPAKEQR